MRVGRLPDWPFPKKFKTLDEIFDWSRKLYKALGEESALRVEELDITTASEENTYLGLNAGRAMTTGYGNTFIGDSAGYSATTSYWTTAVGRMAFYSAVSGWMNTAIGVASLFANTTGIRNVGVGYLSLYNRTTGSSNVAIGTSAGNVGTTGSDNVYIGESAGYSHTGASSVFIGHDAGRNETGDNKLYIANSNTATPLIGGDFNTGQLGINCIPSTSCALDITSTTGALMVPRMTTAQRAALTAANGMIVYDTTDARFKMYMGGNWENIADV